MSKNIFITAELPGEGTSLLQKDYSVDVYREPSVIATDELIARARDADALITMVSDSIDRTVMDSSPGLKIISNCGVGHENIDVKEASNRGIMVTNTPGVLTETTADLAWALMLSIGRRIVEADNYVRSGEFSCWLPTLLLGHNIHKKTLGIYGMGRIGTAVAKRAVGFNMEIVYNNRTPNLTAEKELGARLIDFDQLLTRSDFIVITAPLNNETHGRFGLDEFKRMKHSAVIVNIGRGPIIKENELAQALKEGVIWGAGLDVYENEPAVDPELIKLSNCVLVPHIGSASLETRIRMSDMAIESVVTALGGGIPKHLVNRSAFVDH